MVRPSEVFWINLKPVDSNMRQKFLKIKLQTRLRVSETEDFRMTFKPYRPSVSESQKFLIYKTTNHRLSVRETEVFKDETTNHRARNCKCTDYVIFIKIEVG